MLDVIFSGNALPITYNLDPTASFESGMVGQLKIVGQEVVVGVSDGTAPLGLLDDERTSVFSQPSVDEVTIIPGIEIYSDGYNRFTGKESLARLNHGKVIASSFSTDFEGIILTAENGLVSIPADTQLSYDNDGDGIADSVKIISSYTYEVTSLPGEDSTLGSGRVTIWNQRIIFETDQYDTTAKYPLNAVLFVNAEGKFTTKQPTADHPGVAMVMAPPSILMNKLQAMWF